MFTKRNRARPLFSALCLLAVLPVLVAGCSAREIAVEAPYDSEQAESLRKDLDEIAE